MNPYEFYIDIVPKENKYPITIHCSQYDVGRPFLAHLRYKREAYNIESGSHVYVHVRKPDDTIYSTEAAYTQNGDVYFETEEQMTPVHGICQMEISITNSSQKPIGSANFKMDVEESVLDGGIESESMIPQLEQAIEAAAQAEISADEAAASAAEAATTASGLQTQYDVFEIEVEQTMTTKFAEQDASITSQVATETAEQINAWTDEHWAEIVNNYVTPEMYGAKGDGITDDTEAIQNAINSGRNVVFANKVYLCGIVTISGNNQVISGNYATLTHGTNSGFILAKTAHDIIIRNFNSICTYVKDSQNATNVHIGISADASSPNAEYYVYNITITGCTFTGGVMGVSASSAKGINVNNCKFNSFVYKPEDLSGGYGILLQSCIDCKISFCDFNVGEYGRHDIYISVDQRKSVNKECKNIYIDSCIFSHQDLVKDSSEFYYSPNTVPINVRASTQVNVQNCYFYSVTGAVSFIASDGVINGATILNCVIDAPVHNSGTAETRSIINVTSATNQTSFSASGIDVINEPNDYSLFMSLQNCVAKVTNCNMGATRFVFGQDVTAQIDNITTKITYYLIRFNGGDETKGNCKNITFLNGLTGNEYYFATGSTVPSDFFGEPVEKITLNVEGTNINSLINNSYRQGKVAVLSGYFKPNENSDPSNTILARISGVETIARFEGLAWMGSTIYPLVVSGTRIIVGNVAIPATSNYVFFQCLCILK